MAPVIMDKIKQTIKHVWKYHKLSTIGYVGALLYFLLFAIPGIIILIKEVQLPSYVAHSMIVLLFGYVMFQTVAKYSSTQYKKEQQKEIEKERVT